MKILSYLILGLVSAACTTTAPSRSLKDVAQDRPVISGVVIPLQFKSSHEFIGQQGCDIVVRPIGGLTLLKQFHVNPGRDFAFVELEPGTYSFRELNCGEARADLSFSSFPLFSVYPGKVSVTGAVIIRLSQMGRLGMKVSPLSASIYQGVQKQWDSKHEKPNLVSASSGEPFTETK